MVMVYNLVGDIRTHVERQIVLSAKKEISKVKNREY